MIFVVVAFRMFRFSVSSAVLFASLQLRTIAIFYHICQLKFFAMKLGVCVRVRAHFLFCIAVSAQFNFFSACAATYSLKHSAHMHKKHERISQYADI